MTFFATKQLTASYGRGTVLHNVEVSVDQGDIAVILGANGAGKTTFMRAITGLVKTQGSIVLDGLELVGKRTHSIARHGIAHVPQGRGTFKDLTVADNLRVGGYRLPERQVAALMDRWYDFFPKLKSRSNQLAGGMSGGEQQMLAIARALISQPRLLLLDEPSLGLAPKVTAEVFSVLTEINAETGITVLVVEQNAKVALAAASKGFVMETGRIVRSGPAESMRNDDEIRRAYLG
ncbi:branched-chain amino acid transport system ATP-binding protein [Nocardioides daedukensis]|uniref:Branched-chain amino acid transport system ATP-binding protein n=1 Tax=Nocardioides daedukensis TaxID=634462 RepID=A0A7Y9S447_9ACTN|nr:ABC transporter ATP-binding protein [Nocardioides daedukensis]NYG59753.1 branched-chain amino acid transport system ATP-binding protein [Nocardioides daedukensis]